MPSITFKGLFRTPPNMYDRGFSQKKLTAFNRLKSSIADCRQGRKYLFGFYSNQTMTPFPTKQILAK